MSFNIYFLISDLKQITILIVVTPCCCHNNIIISGYILYVYTYTTIYFIKTIAVIMHQAPLIPRKPDVIRR